MNRLIAGACLGLLLVNIVHAEEKVFAFPDRVLPQVANGQLGGGHFFFMTFEAFSLTAEPATVFIDFYDSAGDPMSLPIPNLQGGFQLLPTIETVVPARGVRFSGTLPFNQPLQVGYARVTVVPEGGARVVALFNNQVPGERLFSAIVPMEPDVHAGFFVPYTNTGGLVSSIAIVSALAQAVDVIARDPEGVEGCRASFAFEAREHLSVILETALPCVAGTDGNIEVIGSAGIGLSGIGFVAADEGLGAFTTKPVYEKP